MHALRHPLLRRVLSGLLLAGIATWLLPPTVRASVLTASAAEQWLRHGIGDTDDAPLPALDERLRQELVRSVAGVLWLQGAVSSTVSLSGAAASAVGKASVWGSRTGIARALPQSLGRMAARTAVPGRSALLVRTLSAARPMGP